MAENNYCIKEGYVSRFVPATLGSDPEFYWNKRRRRLASAFQHHVYQLAAKKLPSFVGPVDICDVGCGFPAKLPLIQAENVASCTVIDQPSLQQVILNNSQNACFIGCDLEQGFLIDKKFDLIVCADVIEHILNPIPLLHSMRERLKKGGVLFISTPERDILRGPSCLCSPKSEHVREWNLPEFRMFLEANGFRVLEHLTLPQRKLSWIEEKLRAFLKQLKITRYNGCQLAVCSLSSPQ